MNKRKKRYYKERVKETLDDLFLLGCNGVKVDKPDNMNTRQLANTLVNKYVKTRFYELMHKGPTWIAWEWFVTTYCYCK